MSYSLKKGVTVNGVQPEILVAMNVVAGVYESLGYRLVVTSLTDGKEWRNPKSLHLAGLAFDCRVWDFPTPESREELGRMIREALGPEYDVVVKDDHIHVEFDVKDQ